MAQNYLTFLAACRSTGARDDSENLVLAHDQKVFTVDLDFRAAVFAKKDAVALFHIEGLARSVFLILAFADCDYFPS